jgi:hypothetical protein
MIEDINNYPLSWPVTWSRTNSSKRQWAPFVKTGGVHHTISEGTDFVLNELRLLGARKIIISSNMQYRQDGRPYAKQIKLDDPGVAVYFELKLTQRVLACDRWTKVEDNLWAIGKHINAIRGQESWGVGTIDQAFVGYEALPAPKNAWWEILGIGRDRPMTEIDSLYRQLAKLHHPNAGGDVEQWLRIQQAYEAAQKEKKA